MATRLCGLVYLFWYARGGACASCSCGCLRRTLPEVGLRTLRGGGGTKGKDSKEGATGETTSKRYRGFVRWIYFSVSISISITISISLSRSLSFLPYSYSFYGLGCVLSVFCGVLLCLSSVCLFACSSIRRSLVLILHSCWSGTWNRVALHYLAKLGGPVENSSSN